MKLAGCAAGGSKPPATKSLETSEEVGSRKFGRSAGNFLAYAAGGSCSQYQYKIMQILSRGKIMSETQLDPVKMEAFGGQMTQILNGASLALMISIGHQTGLFDTMAGLAPSTSQQIADAAHLNERYVREWLGAMTVGGIVVHEPKNQTYHLPPEHAAFLTRAAGLNNMASEMQFIAMLGEVEQGIVNSFHNGGGVPYSEYPRFQKLMAESSANVHNAMLTDTILPIVPGMAAALDNGIKALDMGCGQGHAVNLMAAAFPNSQFYGYDFSEQGISAAKAEASAKGLQNAHFEVRDASQFNERETFDLITGFDVIHDQAHPRVVLKAIFEALKPDGTFLMVDIKASSHVHENMKHPFASYFYTVSTMHCMTVSLALDGEGLGTMWGRQKAQELLAEAGFKQVDVHELAGDTFNDYYVVRKG
jgi:2-polyprenyl-3-methyl-5-hydroxy-6-metoxy-1,4-benzoquinol methylase